MDDTLGMGKANTDMGLSEVLKKGFGDPRFYQRLEQMATLHSRKNKDYAEGGLQGHLGNFARTSAIKRLYPGFDWSSPFGTAMDFMLKQLDAAFILYAQKRESVTGENVPDRLQDVSIYSVIGSLLWSDEQKETSIAKAQRDEFSFDMQGVAKQYPEAGREEQCKCGCGVKVSNISHYHNRVWNREHVSGCNFLPDSRCYCPDPSTKPNNKVDEPAQLDPSAETRCRCGCWEGLPHNPNYMFTKQFAATTKSTEKYPDQCIAKDVPICHCDYCDRICNCGCSEKVRNAHLNAFHLNRHL